ncbi:MAG: TMEM175 family protein [Ferruginibacter sp.]
MGKTRLEAFSDGVIAIIITIMVLEMKAPKGTSWDDLWPLVPKFISYGLSFLFVAIYWVNHHHLIHAVKKVTAGILWANINLLFWLSLIPFATAWMGETNFKKLTVVAYAVVVLLCGIAFNILQGAIVKSYRDQTHIKKYINPHSWKSKGSVALYLIAVPIALYVSPTISAWIFFMVALLWLIPDKKIEKALNEVE